MFRAHRADHQERQIVSIQPLVAVGGRVVCRSEFGRILLELTLWYAGAYAPAYQTVNSNNILPNSDLHTTRPPTATRGCIDTICLS